MVQLSEVLGLFHAKYFFNISIASKNQPPRTKMSRNVYVNIYHTIDFLTPWELCTIKPEVQIDENYHIYEDEEGIEHKLPLHFTAAENEPNYELKPKTRVIARRKHRFFPCFYDVKKGTPAFIYKN